VADDLCTDLDEFLAQTRERPIRNRIGSRERAEEVPEIVGQHMKLKTNSVCVERATREARPLDRALPLFYPLLSRPAFVVKPDDILRRVTQVGDNESNAWEKLSEMPLHFGDNPSRTGPTRRLVTKALVESLDMMRRSPNRAREQRTDSRLQNLICRKADRVLDALGL